MKRYFFAFILIAGILQQAKADTIDYWHVYYNHLKIRECNQIGLYEINIKSDTVKEGDSLTVKYFRDTPCHDCITHLTVENGKHHIYLRSKGMGTFNPLSFPLKELLKYKGQDYLEVFYFEEPIKSRSDKVLIFRIKLE